MSPQRAETRPCILQHPKGLNHCRVGGGQCIPAFSLTFVCTCVHHFMPMGLFVESQSWPWPVTHNTTEVTGSFSRSLQPMRLQLKLQNLPVPTISHRLLIGPRWVPPGLCCMLGSWGANQTPLTPRKLAISGASSASPGAGRSSEQLVVVVPCLHSSLCTFAHLQFPR